MPDKVEPKMVRESDLMAQKAKADKFEKELATIKGQLTQAQSELKIAKMNGEDSEEVKKVKEYLEERDKEVSKREGELNKSLASLEEREKESRVLALATEFGVDIESIRGTENPREKALELKLERLAKEKKEIPKSPEENVFEKGAGGLAKKSILDMSDKEFKDLEASMKKEALSK